MTTSSVPLNKDLEEIVNSFIKRGYAPDKAEVMRKALIFLAEEETVQDVLRAEKEPILRGDLRELAKKFSFPSGDGGNPSPSGEARLKKNMAL